MIGRSVCASLSGGAVCLFARSPAGLLVQSGLMRELAVEPIGKGRGLVRRGWGCLFSRPLRGICMRQQVAVVVVVLVLVATAKLE